MQGLKHNDEQWVTKILSVMNNNLHLKTITKKAINRNPYV